MGAIRFSLGRTTTRQEIEQTVDWLREASGHNESSQIS